MTIKLDPSNEMEVAKHVCDAGKSGKTLEIVGGGTKLGIGHKVHANQQLNTKAISGITLYEPGALTIVVKAGTPLSQVQAALAAENQHLPFEPVTYDKLFKSNGKPTIGGVVACGVSGSRRVQVGACRDSLIGVRFVNGLGEVIKNGGRVMKNVTGYDLVKLMCGSYGTLGILTEVSLKLLPAPKATATITLQGLEFDKAVEAMSKALGSPFDITGAAFQEATENSLSQTFVRIEGFENSVAYRSGELVKLLNEYGATEVNDKPKFNKSIWEKTAEVGYHSDQNGAVWRISLKPGNAPALIAAIAQKGSFSYTADWGGGLIWLRANKVELDDWGGGELSNGLLSLHTLIQNEVSTLGGHATLFRADDKSRIENVFHPEPELVSRITSGIKSQFDPANLLNPGRMRV